MIIHFCVGVCVVCVCVCMHLWVHKCVCVHKCECVCMHVHLWMHKCVCVLPLHVSSVTLDTSRHTRQSQSQISHENRGIPEHTHKWVCTVIIWPQTLDLLWSVSVCTFLILLQGHLSLTRWPQLWSQSPAWHSSLQRCPHPSCTHTHTHNNQSAQSSHILACNTLRFSQHLFGTLILTGAQQLFVLLIRKRELPTKHTHTHSHTHTGHWAFETRPESSRRVTYTHSM